jgi:K+-sensing histidine kinase KdpD
MNDQPGIPRSSSSYGGNTLRYAAYGALFGFAFPVVATAISLAVNNLPTSAASIVLVQVSQPLLWIIDTAPFFLGVFAALAGARQDSVERLNLQLTKQARDLAAAQTLLEQRVDKQRTDELEQRNRVLRQVLQVTRKISRIRDSAVLAQTAVETIAENFSDFAVDLYLIDERRTEVALAASSEGASVELAGRSFRVADASLIGQVAGSGDAGRSITGAIGPELALPLLARGLPVGVLHLHPVEEGVTLPADTELLQLIADQLASAIETARSVREAREALEKLHAVSGQAVQKAWRQALPNERVIYEYTPSGTRPARGTTSELDPYSLRIPLELRGQRIGTIALKRKGTLMWTDADRDLADKTATQVALALENIRLLEETRERAETEQLLSEFSSHLNQSVNLDTLLQIAVRELAGLPEVAGASIYLQPESAPGEQRAAPKDG